MDIYSRQSRPAPEDEAALDRPIWSALISKHRHLALGSDLVRRYPASIAPFAAVADLNPDAEDELRSLAKEGRIALLGPASLAPIKGLDLQHAINLCQMVAVDGAPPAGEAPIASLDAADAPAMLELTALTRPGPFSRDTYRLGRYIGIRDGTRLAAMAGERMRLDGYTEISAVCVHPDYRGRGYAQILMTSLMQLIREDGDTPILHVRDDNTGAITLYERLGFVTRTKFALTILQHPEAAD